MGGSAIRPSAKLIPSQESFQPWLTSPRLVLRAVLDEAVAVFIAVVLDPFERCVRYRQQGRTSVMSAPAPHSPSSRRTAGSRSSP